MLTISPPILLRFSDDPHQYGTRFPGPLYQQIPNKMKLNMGSYDRTIRIVVAIIISALYFSGTISGVFGSVLLVLSGVFLITGFVGFCPLYAPFKFSTRKQ